VLGSLWMLDILDANLDWCPALWQLPSRSGAGVPMHAPQWRRCSYLLSPLFDILTFLHTTPSVTRSRQQQHYLGISHQMPSTIQRKRLMLCLPLEVTAIPSILYSNQPHPLATITPGQQQHGGKHEGIPNCDTTIHQRAFRNHQEAPGEV
jgi:hypothetical protein